MSSALERKLASPIHSITLSLHCTYLTGRTAALNRLDYRWLFVAILSMEVQAPPRRRIMFLIATNFLCKRGAWAFLQPKTLHVRANRCSFHHARSLSPIYSTTRLKQNANGSGGSDASDTIEPTWVYTPYKPPTKPKPRPNNTRRFSSTTEWKVPETIFIPEDQLEISFVRSSGAGGQNVNKLNTKVELRFHVDSATWIPSEVRDRLKTNESNRINNEGYLSLTCQEHRTQVQNRKEALNKLREILRESWKRPKVRKMRKGLSKKTKENRMEMKRRTAEKKANRKRVDF